MIHGILLLKKNQAVMSCETAILYFVKKTQRLAVIS